jgi:hypothetical protein
MTVQTSSHRGAGTLGVVLIVGGAIALVAQRTGLGVNRLVDEATWPLAVLVPGIVLLVAAFVVAPPKGAGLAVAGSVVTAVGLLLWYQNTTGHWESWAYAWALIAPGGVGLGLLVYGLVFGERGLVGTGVTMAAVGAGLFLAGAWYFESIFSSGRAPFDAGATWPVVLIFVGAALLAGAIVRSRTQRRDAEALTDR